MTSSCFSRRNAVLFMTIWIAFAFAGTSRAQFLKPGETAPAPSFVMSRSGSTPIR